MKYEAPELTQLKPAINAIQTTPPEKQFNTGTDSSQSWENTSAYEDWE